MKSTDNPSVEEIESVVVVSIAELQRQVQDILQQLSQHVCRYWPILLLIWPI
jgi:hypothetical protein